MVAKVPNPERDGRNSHVTVDECEPADGKIECQDGSNHSPDVLLEATAGGTAAACSDTSPAVIGYLRIAPLAIHLLTNLAPSHFPRTTMGGSLSL